MSKLVGILGLSIVLAIIKAALTALVVAMILALLWSFITRPKETIVFVVACSLSCVAVAQPIACVVGVTVVVIVLGLAGRRRKPLPALQLSRHQ